MKKKKLGTLTKISFTCFNIYRQQRLLLNSIKLYLSYPPPPDCLDHMKIQNNLNFSPPFHQRLSPSKTPEASSCAQPSATLRHTMTSREN